MSSRSPDAAVPLAGALTPVGEQMRDALKALSDAVCAYGALDVEDVESAEWDAVLAADKEARAALAKAGMQS